MRQCVATRVEGAGGRRNRVFFFILVVVLVPSELNPLWPRPHSAVPLLWCLASQDAAADPLATSVAVVLVLVVTRRVKVHEGRVGSDDLLAARRRLFRRRQRQIG